jgi:hypothetical protein
MPTTYTQIGTAVTVGSGGATSIDFTSIPSTYTDLILKISARTTRTSTATDWVKIAFNGVTTNLTMKLLYGEGSSTGSYSDTAIYGGISSNAATSNTFGNSEIYIPNYAGNSNKSISFDSVGETNASTGNYLSLTSGLWSSSAAITSISLTPYTGPNFMQHTTAYLYGVSNA